MANPETVLNFQLGNMQRRALNELQELRDRLDGIERQLKHKFRVTAHIGQAANDLAETLGAYNALDELSEAVK
jgi:DNA-binding transcriptional LysR family regulator